MIEFLMPSLGADMEEGQFVEWRVEPGDRVSRGQVVCVVETQKGAIDVEIWDAGTVDTLLAEPGQTIPVGGVLAWIRREGEPAEPVQKPVEPLREERPAPPTPAAGPGVAAEAPAAPSESGPRLRISPAARKRAAELGIDPATVEAGAADGAISLADIERAAETLKTVRPTPMAETPAAERTDDGRRRAMREAIATAMARSNREIPHYYLGTTLDVESALRWLEARNAALPVAERLIFPVLQLRAVALALRDVPALNGWYLDGAFHPAEAINLGVAVALRGGGLVAPALRDADTLDSTAMMGALRDLLQRARASQLRSSELTETSITITNLGDLGVESVYGVIYPPQVALVGFGRIVERPWAEDGKLFAARCLQVTLAADHRATDGAVGARFLTRLTDYLQDPESLWQS